PARYSADTGNEACGMNVAAVHAEGGERRKLKKWRARIEQRIDAITRQQLAAGGVTLARPLGSSLRCRRASRDEFGVELLHRRGIAIEFLRPDGDLRLEHGHEGERSPQATSIRGRSQGSLSAASFQAWNALVPRTASM